MAPRLRVLISTPGQAYPPTQLLPVNSNTPTPIRTPGFEGDVSVWVKDFTGDEKRGEGEEYFGQEGRGDMTYAIVTRGKSSWVFLTLKNIESRATEEIY